VKQLPAVLEKRMAALRDNRAPAMSTWMAAIFIFNLVVGTGALALPAAFQKVANYRYSRRFEILK
jgi:hypothetical protein